LQISGGDMSDRDRLMAAKEQMAQVERCSSAASAGSIVPLTEAVILKAYRASFPTAGIERVLIYNVGVHDIEKPNHFLIRLAENLTGKKMERG